MLIECAICGKSYKTLESQLPKEKTVSFSCKGCGTKLKITPLKNRPGKNTTIIAVPADGSGGDAYVAGPGAGQSLKDKIVSDIDKLPPLPQVVFRVHELIASPDSSAKQIAKEIETDQAIAAKVLRIANSAYYGMGGKISSVQHASVVLGYKTLGEIVTIAGAEGTLEGKLPGYGYDTHDLWEHSLAVAFGSKTIALTRQPELANEAYTAGLIHDIGKIILDPYIVDQKELIDDYLEREEKTFLDAENHFFGFNHAEIAYEVCKQWNFPESIATAIRFHHGPSASNGHVLAYILHMADYQAKVSGTGYEQDDYLYEIETGTMDFLGISHDEAGRISIETMESMSQFSS